MALQRPYFIHRAGSMIQHPPFMQKDSHMYGFFVKGQLEKIQNLIDRQLNSITGGQYSFKTLSEYMIITFVKINKSYSLTASDKAKGWGSETEAAIWLPVGNMMEKQGKHYIKQVFWFTPYIWVDNPIAAMVGHEIYGYPKTIGRFDFPDIDKSDKFGLTVNGYQTFNCNSEAQWLKLLHIESINNPASKPQQHWKHFTDATSTIWSAMANKQLMCPDWHRCTETIKELLPPQLMQVFLKQTVDVTGVKAEYQALITAPATVGKFYNGKLLEDSFELTVNAIDSYPLTKDLGLSIGTQTMALGFYLHFDFILGAAKVLIDNSQIKPEKLAILGGGISSLTTAFALTNQPGWQNRYQITLYQQGWRLGGKGASGRNSAQGERIEEHGLHIWFGFYKNAFDVIQQIYKELDRPEGTPLRTWEDALKPHNFIVHMEYIKNQWIPWYLNFPYKEGDPAQGQESLSFWHLIQAIHTFIKQWLISIKKEVYKVENIKRHTNKKTTQRFSQQLKELSQWIMNNKKNDISIIIKNASKFSIKIKNQKEKENINHSLLRKTLLEIKQWTDKEITQYLEDHTDIRRLYIGIDLGITVLTGMINDKIFNLGFDTINHLDFRQWLVKHGANKKFTANSSAIQALYDLVFGYENGNIDTPNVEAGTLLRGMLRLGLGYTGGVMWKMQAGMGDTMFTPFYEVLKKRGVQFKFFHKVEELALAPSDKKSVQTIKLTQQIDLIKGPDSYQPLTEVKKINCWPHEPLYDQIEPEQAKLLKENNIDLECFWSQWPHIYQQHYGYPLKEIILEKGKDFDTIVFGIPIASLPFLCQQLLTHSAALQAAHQHIKTTATQAYQLWTNANLTQLGWTKHSPCGEEPILGAWTEPLDTWAAMNQLLAKEDWSQLGLNPQNIAYFCGVQPITDIPPATDYNFPVQCTEKAKQAAIDQLSNDIHNLWPNAATPGQFNWQLLTDHTNQVGKDRFNSQYWRSNVSPSDRYVLSVVNSTQYRIDTKLDDFNNIYFTGDWIKNGLNAGCVEGATMSGLRTSRAIAGYPIIIKGENDFANTAS